MNIPKLSVRIIVLIAVALLSLNQAIADAGTKEELDKEYRGRIRTFYRSKEFREMPSHETPAFVGRIAHEVYAPHAAVLADAAKKRFFELPFLSEASIPDKDNATMVPLFDLMKPDSDRSREALETVITRVGGLPYMNNWEPGSASRNAMIFARKQAQGNEGEANKAILLSGLSKELVYRMNEDPKRPRIAVESLGEWFLVDLEWLEFGFYAPLRVEWRRAKVEPQQ